MQCSERNVLTDNYNINKINNAPDKIANTTSVPMNKAYIIFEKSNYVNFDQVSWRNYEHVQYKINMVRCIMKYIFTWYPYNIIVVDNFFKKFGQSLLGLNFSEKYKPYSLEWREYLLSISIQVGVGLPPRR